MRFLANYVLNSLKQSLVAAIFQAFSGCTSHATDVDFQVFESGICLNHM